MKNLSALLKQPLSKISTGVVVALLVIALLGFADATYLTAEHYKGEIPPCSIVTGCELVLTSSYSVFLGIPTALFGSIYYFLIALGAFVFFEARISGRASALHYRILKWTLLATVAGLLMSVWFTFVQVFILEAYCLYCLGSALTSVLLFVVAMLVLEHNENV